jgi:hypothetical protein
LTRSGVVSSRTGTSAGYAGRAVHNDKRPATVRGTE